MRRPPIALLLVVLTLTGGVACAMRRHASATLPGERRWSTSVSLNGTALELHLIAPAHPRSPVLVTYASGDGGWFGTAVGMFDDIGADGYYAAGFSARAYFKLRAPSHAMSAGQVADDYQRIIATALTSLGLGARTPVVVTGWSRGAGLAVLVAAAPHGGVSLSGVVGIGLPADDRLAETSASDDDGPPAGRDDDGRFETYPMLKRLAPLPVAVIQATHDRFLDAGRARELLGPDTPARRLFTVDAANHRFGGGIAGFRSALREALAWVASTP